MKRTRRKGNVKLRRRIRKTVASLFMIMAIIVAAIPVENYGTMQAAGATAPSFDMDGMYLTESFEELYKPSEYENTYHGDVITVQRIKDGNFVSAFKAKKKESNNDDAVITEYTVQNDQTDFVINSEEYYDYIKFEANDITEIENFFSNEKYTVEFETTLKSFAGGSATVDGNTEVLAAIDLISIDSSEKTRNYTYADPISAGSIVGSCEYKKVHRAVTGDMVKEIYTGCAKDILDTQLTLVTDYNKLVSTAASKLDTIQKKINNGTNLTVDEKDIWNSYVASVSTNGELAKKLNDAKTLTNKYSDLLKIDDNGDGLKDITHYSICQRFSNSNGTNTLINYGLERVVQEDGIPVYIPKLLKGKSQESGQIVDKQGYLVTGYAKIKGISSKAFLDARITNVTIPDSIEFIGSEAFSNATLQSVILDDKSCVIIGDNAFSGCTSLSTFNFTNASSKLKTLGTKAFSQSGLKEIIIPGTVEKVGKGCFASSKVSSVTFNTGINTAVIEAFAFFNCGKLSTVNFASDRNYEIKTGAFALGAGNEEYLENFSFPKAMTAINAGGDSKYDYILAGRKILKSVTLPDRLGDVRGSGSPKIPDNTFAGCNGLEQVVFPSNAYYATYDPEKLFQYVENTSFYVEGPKFMGSNESSPAKPRETTWKAVNAYGDAVPYQYTDKKGTHLELGKDDATYIEGIDVIANTQTAILSKYEVNGNLPGNNIEVIIPPTVGRYTIVEIAEGCFGEKIKDKICRVTISDGTVKKIANGAFEGCKELQWVFLGDSVKEIGSNAFSNCPKLENIEFSQTETGTWGTDDTSYWTQLTLGDNAFNTQSDKLTFHGAIHPDYAPYKLAMSEDSVNMTSSKCQICYKTDAPLNLTVIRDNVTGKSTLIDYPHYEEIDVINEEYVAKQLKKYNESPYNYGLTNYSITDKFEEISERNGVLTGTSSGSSEYTQFDAMDDLEADIVEQTLNLKIPYGVESVDTASYFEGKENKKANSADYVYFNLVYKPELVDGKLIGYNEATLDRKINSASGGAYTSDVKKLYSDSSTQPMASRTTHPGLFSGFFDESTDERTRSSISTFSALDPGKGLMWKTLNGKEYTEYNNAGNDYLSSVSLDSVEMLPDYAFDSNENVQKISLGSELESVGKLPFKDCKSLYDVKTGNDKYSFENMLFYENGENGTKIVQCLEGRGYGGEYGNSSVNADTNPKLTSVTEIAENAFSDCDKIWEVDLSKSSVRVIPSYCFNNSSELTSVKLPKTVSRIDEHAFSEIENKVLSIEIPNPLCVISDKAIDGNTKVTISCIEYIDEGTKEYSPCYESVQQLKTLYGDNVTIKPLGNTYTVRFVDKDLKLIDSEVVESGGSVEPPTAPEVTGYKFLKWQCLVGDTVLTGEATYTGITEDRMIIAAYEPDPSSVVPDGKTYTLKVEGGKALDTENGTTPQTQLSIKGGTTVTLIYTEVSGTEFKNWSVNNDDYTKLITNTNASITTFTMPNANVTVKANTTTSSGSGSGSGSSGSGSGSGSSGSGSTSDSDTKTKYKLTVNYGTGSGEYAEGDTVTITANSPDSSRKVFSRWTTDNTNVTFASSTSATTTIKMPASTVVVTANYKTKSSSDDDDDDTTSSSRRPSSSTSTVTTTTNNSANTTTGTNAATTTGTVTRSGEDKLYITKNGVSNKDVGTANVEGSTDNFVVKITESEEATAAVEAALRNKYGSLDGISYFPMDISLYDSTGKNKIQDTYGLNVTVTMPIPDALIQYGGNAHVAAADNGYLQELNPRFTTIDGIACISFVPPHFSPYVIYVDTNNLIAGQSLDATPATGDPIHPKWFLAIGMACISVIMFITGDKKKKLKYAN